MRQAIMLMAGGLLLTGCGTEVSADRAPDPDLLMTAGTVTVLDDGRGSELCLGGVAESLPPQCGGPPLEGWDWSDHDGDFEEVRGTRWGDFHVVGEYDGTTFTVARATPAAAYDAPAPPEEVAPAPGSGLTQSELRQIQRELVERPDHLGSGASNGVVELHVIRDDGSVQAELDAAYGAGVVEVSSALVPARP